MKLSRRRLLKSSAFVSIASQLGGGLGAAAIPKLALADDASNAPDQIPTDNDVLAPERGLFQPTWDSLVAHYQAPDWFRDAKLGIWAHWGPQCQPEAGDWYARGMYEPGSRAYKHHLKHYGHPSKTGFLDIIGQWKAENWQPEQLLKRYKDAGAKYIVSMANHHDNFDNYNSRFHEWNSVRVGPKRDIVGTWAKLARENGLRFGVSNHAAHAWHWYQVAYGYDGDGEFAGARYDAARLSKADGKGTWWEGLDPQDLYTGPNLKMPDGLKTAKAVSDWHKKYTRPWDERAPSMNPAFTHSWYLRCQDLIDQYKPDLLYFDDTELPLQQAGLDIAAYFYNANMRWHGGKLEAVLNAKWLRPEHIAAMVDDVERGLSDAMRSLPWQTDTCIGAWHYDRELYEKHRYKTVFNVLSQLCDIVSKNGNLLLNIPVRGDGTIDDDEIKILDGMAKWMAINGEAIFGTRPWTVFGEGPTEVKSGMFGENKLKPFTARDIRFTSKGGVVYALMLGWPEASEITIKSLADSAPGRIERVSLLGGGKLKYDRGPQGLTIKLPSQKPGEHVFAFKVEGRNLV